MKLIGGIFDKKSLDRFWNGGTANFCDAFSDPVDSIGEKKESHIPLLFWYLSLLGSIILLSYAIHRRDPVFILGQSTGFIVYIRNLMLIYKKRWNPASDSTLNPEK